MKTYAISDEELGFEELETILRERTRVVLSEDAVKRIRHCRRYLDERVARHEGAVYGINTGFGALYDKSISTQDLGKLQWNLMTSHACGTGEPVPADVVRLMLVLKAKGLAYGNSGVQVATVQRLLDFLNHDILPVVYSQGSLGASGDLAPLAHLCLPLIGEGEVVMGGKQVSAKVALRKMGWKPIELQSKEGLALLNGTQFMSSWLVYSVLHAFHLASMADLIGTLSLEAYDGRPEPFDPLLHKIRPHQGQLDVASNIRNLLKGSRLIRRKKVHVQDPYSFRCIPQVHGASRDAITYVAGTVLTEINSVTDNPTVFPDDDKVLSGGNFHGQPLALAADFLAIALAELGSISERRTYLLISGQRGLPPFLVADPGLNSGFMIPQYTAASIVSQNKQLCTPASIDSIVSSNGQEDHVSMGANAATKAWKVTENLQSVLAIELMTAAQAIEFRRPATTSPVLEEFLASFRKRVKFVEKDRVLYEDIRDSRGFLSLF
ncbi:MAG: histidine ammonia-lyase [Bacteroidota bacterium]